MPARAHAWPVVVAVPTCAGREDMLLGRSLPSIYAQQARPLHVLVVADRDVAPDDPLHARIAACRRAFLAIATGLPIEQVPDDLFPTTLLENRRTRHHSLTGSVNTAAEVAAAKFGDDVWLATLDDDDAWQPTYLASCLAHTGGRPGSPWLVCPGHRRIGYRQVHPIVPPPGLTPEHLFFGNPGLTGSTLFVALSTFREVGGYDETLPSTTDRDLYVRLLDHLASRPGAVAFPQTALVDQYADGHARVTTDRHVKHAGLDRFYAKHRHRMAPDLYAASVARARALFGYEPR